MFKKIILYTVLLFFYLSFSCAYAISFSEIINAEKSVGFGVSYSLSSLEISEGSTSAEKLETPNFSLENISPHLSLIYNPPTKVGFEIGYGLNFGITNFTHQKVQIENKINNLDLGKKVRNIEILPYIMPKYELGFARLGVQAGIAVTSFEGEYYITNGCVTKKSEISVDFIKSNCVLENVNTEPKYILPISFIVDFGSIKGPGVFFQNSTDWLFSVNDGNKTYERNSQTLILGFRMPL